MKKTASRPITLSAAAAAFAFAAVLSACSNPLAAVDGVAANRAEEDRADDSYAAAAPLAVEAALADDPAIAPTPSGSRWAEATHRTVAAIAASKLGVSASRIAVISDASDDPDTYQSGLDNAYNQQWSHAYLYDLTFGSSYWFWGDADDDFHDNLLGPSGGEGYQGGYAGARYASGDQRGGDRYLGYALHFIEDVCLTVHSTAPTSMGVTVPYKTTDMLTNHFKFEDWMAANMESGWKLMDAVRADGYYYAVTDPKASIRSAAWRSCAYAGTASIGYVAWTEFRKAGFPTGAGTGSAALANAARSMLVNAARYAKGAIKYCLDTFGQWSAAY